MRGNGLLHDGAIHAQSGRGAFFVLFRKGAVTLNIGSENRRHATVEAVTELLLAEFDPAALEKMSLGAQLQLTRALVRNVTDRLALANARLAR